MARPYSKSLQAILISLVAGIIIFIHPPYEPILILTLGAWGVLGSGLFGFFPFAFNFKDQVLNSDIMKLTIVCLKAGFLVFGTGLAIIPVLEADVVGKYHWLTKPEFLDGLALGQITPGPVTTTATFIGYKVGGFGGAILATMAIFLSAFINVLIIIPMVEKKMKNHPEKMKSFTDWAFPAVIGGIVATSLRLTMTTVTTWFLLAWIVAAALVVWKFRPPAWALIPASGILYFAATFHPLL
jgi:chromate transporter